MMPLKPGPRAGWAEASRNIGREGDDGLAWPEFGYLDDQTLIW